MYELGEVVAERRIAVVLPDGGTSELVVRFGKPHPDPLPGGDWCCPFQIEGLGDGAVDAAFGVDSLQAMLLAAYRVRLLLTEHAEQTAARLDWLGQPELGLRVDPGLVLQDVTTRDAYLAAADITAALLRTPLLAERWTSPSALPYYSTGGLARHLANQITRTAELLDAPPGHTAIDVLAHFTGSGWVTTGADEADNTDIRERGERAAAETTADRLAAEVDGCLARLHRTVPAQPPYRIVDLGDWGLTVDDFLLTRLLEMVVHGDDLAVSLDLPTPEMPTAATELTTDLLTRIAAWRHGPLAVVRALSRRERAPETISAL
ncbi:maleylpyruvate isomerase N-terminal domain-containing protein [Verrucosispora sioxanthis]|uniref:maleylpyruvate isomerase N-terminal domain-containing protein n=1 Tax=Verrucosispora sioxanthis TaxID=2499994 RepID=UPI001F360FCD|nr:maleylpyruvate isomerase N-terminal domain-containing protein [Verrucosispora sioxanthis]